MRLIDFLLTCAGTALNLLLAYPLFDCLWVKRQKRSLRILSVLFSFVLYVVLLLLYGDTDIKPFFFLLPLFAMTLLFQTKAWQRVLFCAVFFTVACTSEIMVKLLSDYYFCIEYAVAPYLLYTLQITLISKFFVFAFVAAVRIKQKSALSDTTKKYYLLLPLFLLVSIAILVLQYYVFPDFPLEMQSLLIVVALCFTVLTVACILMLAYLDLWQQNLLSEKKIAAADEIIDSQISQYRSLVEHHRDVIKMRHDHQNFCIGVLNELENGNTQAVVAKLKNECALLQSAKERSGDIIHSVVKFKQETAKTHGIEIDFEYRKLDRIAVSSIDLAVILGNALDNAIEATAELGDTSKKTIRLLVALKNNTIVISVKNPVSKKVNVMHLTTQKEHSSHHGFGIISMRQLAAKYGGEVLFDCTEEIFSVSIILNNFTV